MIRLSSGAEWIPHTGITLGQGLSPAPRDREISTDPPTRASLSQSGQASGFPTPPPRFKSETAHEVPWGSWTSFRFLGPESQVRFLVGLFGRSAAWLTHSADNRGDVGSNPSARTLARSVVVSRRLDMAETGVRLSPCQLKARSSVVERLAHIEEVPGSNPGVPIGPVGREAEQTS